MKQPVLMFRREHCGEQGILRASQDNHAIIWQRVSYEEEKRGEKKVQSAAPKSTIVDLEWVFSLWVTGHWRHHCRLVVKQQEYLARVQKAGRADFGRHDVLVDVHPFE